MIAEFERRIAEMPHDQLQVTFAAMVLAATDATSERSFAWFEERVESARQEFARRGLSPEPPPVLEYQESRTPPERHWASHRPDLASTRKLTFEQAEQVRHRHAQGASVRELGQDYGVSGATIKRIVDFVTYREEPA